MLIKDIVTMAKVGELSSVSTRNDIDAIVAFMNLGMLELYGRFTLKTSEYVITMDSNVNEYQLPDDYLSIIEAFGEAHHSSPNQTVVIPINDPEDESSIYLTGWNVIQIPDPEDGGRIAIMYVTKPEPITREQAEDGVTSINLPPTLIEPLLQFIGYRGHLGVKSDAQSENNAHWARFERSCKKVEDFGTGQAARDVSMSNRVKDRGFA